MEALVPDTAFALGGLGGFNAHGAGFLAAAHDGGIVPDLVTATSGQILMVEQWLADPTKLEQAIVDTYRAYNPFAQMQTGLFGLSGVFRPAYADAFQRFFSPPDFSQGWANAWANWFAPAEQCVPERSQQDFENAAAALNHAQIGDKKIGIVFNTYDFESGRGVLYGNDQARALLPDTSNLAPQDISEDVRLRGTVPAAKSVRPITPEVIKAALWLSLYGFDKLPDGQMDGAYHRACLVAELHAFKRVFVARPLANGWLGAERPRNWFEVQDWQYEMWFSAAYKAEVDAMVRINQLIDSGHLTDDRYNKVELIEVAPDTPAGYFNYFVERGGVFDAAYRKAKAAFARHHNPSDNHKVATP